MIRTRSPRSPEPPSFSSPPPAGRRRTDEGDFGAGSSFLVLIIARPRQARAGAVADAHRGIGFGFYCVMIGLYCGLSCACEQPHFKSKVPAESRLISNLPNGYQHWVARKQLFGGLKVGGWHQNNRRWKMMPCNSCWLDAPRKNSVLCGFDWQSSSAHLSIL